MENFIDWIFSTKAGRFVFIMIFDTIVFGIIASVTTLGFGLMMLVGVICVLFLSVFDNNKRWY